MILKSARTLQVALLLFSLIANIQFADAQRRAAPKKKPAETAKKANARDTKANARQTARDARSASTARTNNRNERATSRTNARDAREDRAKGKTAAARQSRREREEAARREAARRQQEREEAARRAEAARQAAIARERAVNQALHDQTAANIARDETTGEDLEVRRVAIEALGNHAGTVVVMDPRTGRIYTIINQDWAVRRGFKPCSTIKLVTGIAGMCEQVIPQTEMAGTGNRSSLDLTDSLAFSNNGYFQSVGSRVGFERMISYARQLGLGERTGINHVNESAGRVPVFKSGFALSRMCSHGDDFDVTPMQLATLVSAIANGGTMLTPHLPRTPQEGVNFKTEVRRKLTIPQDVLQRMVPGMIGAVNYGTAKLAYDPTQTVGGKTGTCIDDGTWIGLFASYAPINDPKLAVIVVTKGTGERGKVAAGIAGRIYRGLNYRFRSGAGANLPLAVAPQPTPQTPRPNANGVHSLSDEDEADAAEMEESLPGSNSTPRQTNGQQNGVQRVVKPVENPRPQMRPTEAAPRPVAPASNTRPQSSAPAGNTNGTDGTGGATTQRPRRVLTNNP